MSKITNRFSKKVIKAGDKPFKELVHEYYTEQMEKYGSANFISIELANKDLSGLNLDGADFSGNVFVRTNFNECSLKNANFEFATISIPILQSVDLSGCNLKDTFFHNTLLSDVKLTGATLINTYFNTSNLSKTDLTGAKLKTQEGEIFTVKKWKYYHNAYKYSAAGFISEDNLAFIRLGCFLRSVEDWEEDFWNNEYEFPDDGSKESLKRLNAYKKCLNWILKNKEMK